ncbi:MAG: hypothetical protein OXU53_07910 [Deltaproteobacteria bacterium]|nr:hypothetical protein [Deltaproteobacteria bacterium]
MSEQTANGRNENGRRFRLYEITIAGLLGLISIMLTIMFTVLFTSIQQLSDRVDENSRQITEIRLILVKMQTTLDLIAGGLDIRVEPKDEEQTGPAAGPADAPAPGEKLATKDP